jgi:TonB family protein
MRIAGFFALLFSLGLLVGGAKSQDTSAVLPRVLQHAAPVYPPLARQTRISGDVRLKITTDGESVRDVEVESGHPLLQQAAVDNVKTWKFEAHEPGTFEVTFRYKLLPEDLSTEFLESPGIVRIEATPPQMTIDWGWASLGTWKAEFKSAQEDFSGTLKLSFSGPKDAWLDGELAMGKSSKTEVDYGYREGNFLAFSMKLKRADGKRVKTFFVAKIMQDKIAGTFVDDAGVTGEWTAARTGR